MSYYNDLKSKTDIINIAKVLGYKGIKAGNVWQGDCPRHGSSRGKCLVLWPGRPYKDSDAITAEKVEMSSIWSNYIKDATMPQLSIIWLNELECLICPAKRICHQ